eukprot:gene11811-15807_t
MKRKQNEITKSTGSDFQNMLKLLQKKKLTVAVNNQMINEQQIKNSSSLIESTTATSVATNSVVGKCVLGMSGSFLNLNSSIINARLQEFLGLLDYDMHLLKVNDENMDYFNGTITILALSKYGLKCVIQSFIVKGVIHYNAAIIRLKSVDCDLKSSISIISSTPCQKWSDKQIVIAHYEENLDWIPSSWSKIAYIYNKSTASCVNTNTAMSDMKIKEDDNSSKQKNLNFFTEQLPNVGRESHTYLYHIISKYDQLADVTYFTQGHPFDHAPDFLELVEANVGVVEPFLFLGCQQTTIQNQNVSKYERSYPGIQAGFNRTISTLFGTSVTLPKITFSPGAIFCVQREKIYERSIEFYKTALNLLDHGSDPIEGYAFERLWREIFS